MARAAVPVALLLLWVAAGPAHADPACPRPPGVPPGARYSCPTHTQSQQVGEPFTRHPGGSPGRGPGASPYGNSQQSIHCQIEQDGQCHCGPRQGTGRNIPCRPDMQRLPQGPAAPPQPPSPPQPPPAPQVKTIFNYYYINGINTPLGGTGRGNYTWDWNMIKGNLLDGSGGAARVGDVPQQGPGYQVKVRVGNEIDVLKQDTHNWSGADRTTTAAVDDFCRRARGSGFGGLAGMLCPAARGGAGWWDNRRAAGFSRMADGDILECVMQAQGFDIGKGLTGIEFTARLKVVTDIADAILQIYQRERERTWQGQSELNYFILIGHSQGNFFTEGVAFALGQRMGDGVHVQMRRLGILALASPTSYDSLPLVLQRRHLQHFTRADDAIVSLAAMNTFLGGKSPFPPNQKRLWPWPVTAPLDMLAAMNLTAPEACNCKSPNDALYTPQMNSHLIDNYLTDPTLSRPGRVIHPEAVRTMLRTRPDDSLLRQGLSPDPPAVLGNVRAGLAQLKRELLKGQ